MGFVSRALEVVYLFLAAVSLASFGTLKVSSASKTRRRENTNVPGDASCKKSRWHLKRTPSAARTMKSAVVEAKSGWKLFSDKETLLEDAI